MAQENDSRFAIVATLLAFGLVGGISLLLWALTGRVDRAVPLQATGGLSLDEALPESVRSRVSSGGKLKTISTALAGLMASPFGWC